MKPTDSIWVVRLDAPGGGPRLAVKDCIDVEGLPTTAGCQAIAEQAGAALARHPVLALPALTGAPPVIGERMSLTILTMPANLAGLPALVLPVPGGPAGLPRLPPADRPARRRGAADRPRPRPRGRPAQVTAPG